ncbi:MAG: exonuclease [Thiotrichales bacterium]|nr:exonuclease [Thiotrichales bacterium]
MTESLNAIDIHELQGFPERMVLLDCETTGGKATRDRISEIALLVVDQGRLLKRWHTLINPQTPIPPWIQKLTGIRNEMVQNAPTFAEIAPILQAVCEDRVLVAHNARFDYGFIKNEFKRLGQSFQAKTLCSVKLSRHFYPHFHRHTLDHLIARLNVTPSARHRALGDAEVIWAFFCQLNTEFDTQEIEAACSSLLKKPALPANLPLASVQNLPSHPGVYRFWAEEQLLYVGKSVRIKERVLSHFTQDHAVAKDVQMSGRITDIDYLSTPSDFSAQLIESEWVKQQRPQMNRRLKKQTQLFQWQLRADENGYLGCHLVTADSDAGNDSGEEMRFGLFRSRTQATQRLEQLCQRHQLCAHLLGLEKRGTGGCFALQLKKCLGACCGKEPPASYNLRLVEAMARFKQQVWPWPEAIIVKEPSHEESDVCWYHWIDQWRYLQRFTDSEALCSLLNALDADDTQMPIPNPAEPPLFDLDTYAIFVRFLLKENPAPLQIIPLSQARQGCFAQGYRNTE